MGAKHLVLTERETGGGEEREREHWHWLIIDKRNREVWWVSVLRRLRGEAIEPPPQPPCFAGEHRGWGQAVCLAVGRDAPQREDTALLHRREAPIANLEYVQVRKVCSA